MILRVRQSNFTLQHEENDCGFQIKMEDSYFADTILTEKNSCSYIKVLFTGPLLERFLDISSFGRNNSVFPPP